MYFLDYTINLDSFDIIFKKGSLNAKMNDTDKKPSISKVVLLFINRTLLTVKIDFVELFSRQLDM